MARKLMNTTRMKLWFVLSAMSMAACGASSGVKGSLIVYGGNDQCHDEDGDPLQLRVDAYAPGTYDGYGGTASPIDELYVACEAAAFELALPAGRYDIAMIAFQDNLGIGLLGYEDEAVARDVAVVDGRYTSVGIYTLDVNDDD